MKNLDKNLKKKVLYRCLYSGTKETDILYKKFIVSKIDKFSKNELKLIIDLLNSYSDPEISLILSKKITAQSKFLDLIDTILNI